MSLIFAILCLLLALTGVVVRKTYSRKPVQEWRRLAKRHNAEAVRIYPAVAYDGSMRILLGVWIALTGALSIVLFVRVMPLLVALVAIPLLLWLVFSWIPASRAGSLTMRLTLAVTPAVVWILERTYPVLSRLSRRLHRRYHTHTQLYEREDLLELIDRQAEQADNRVTPEELEIAKRALSFDEHTVGEVLTPRKLVKSVLVGDTLGPILIDELHKAGQEHVLVRETKNGAFVGTLDFKHLNLHHDGRVGDVMTPRAYYVHEEDPLSEALHAFFVTNHPVFIVVNSDEEWLGIITIENVLKQLLGHVPGDEFDQYANLPAVAARHKKPEPKAPHEDLSDDDIEVIDMSDPGVTDDKVVE